MGSPILNFICCITPSKQITCFWGDLSAANKWTVRNYHVNTFKWRTYEIDSHLVQLEVPPSVNDIDWNMLFGIMVHNEQEMTLGDSAVTFSRSVTDVTDPKCDGRVFLCKKRPQQQSFDSLPQRAPIQIRNIAILRWTFCNFSHVPSSALLRCSNFNTRTHMHF